MAEKSQATYRAILEPDQRVKVSNLASTADGSSYSESGPRAGVPVAQQDTDMTLEASGEQSAGGALRLQCVTGGPPGRDDAGFVWKQSADSTWRGWEFPYTISSMSDVDLTVNYSRKHQITLANGEVLLVRSYQGGGAATVYSKRMTTAGVWGADKTVHTETVYATHLFPCLLQMPDDRILCFHVSVDIPTEQTKIQMRYSTDNGDTWSFGADNVVTDWYPFDDWEENAKIRCAYADGQIVMFVVTDDDTHTHYDTLTQWASSDGGYHFTQVYTDTGADADNSHAIVEVQPLDGGGFVVFYVRDSDWYPCWRVIGNAFDDWSAATETVLASTAISGTGSRMVNTWMASARDEQGVIYVYWTAINDNDCTGRVSYDDGATFVQPALYELVVSDYNWCDWGNTTPTDITACYQRGRALMTFSNPATDGCWLLGLGGFSDVTLPAMVPFEAPNRYMPWIVDWFAQLPTAGAQWAATGAGGAAFANGILTLTPGAGQNIFYEQNPTTTNLQGVIAEAQWRADTNGSAVRIELDDTTHAFAVEVRMDGTAKTLLLWDVVAGAMVGSSDAIDSSTWYDVRVAINDPTGAGGNTGQCSVWWRASDGLEDREWTLLATTTTLQRVAGGTYGGVDAVIFGHATAAAAESDWRRVHYTVGNPLNSAQLAGGQTNPDDLAPRRLTSTPSYIEDGTLIAATDGPANYGDTWNVDTRHDYPVENLHPLTSPSPADVWRSTNTTDQAIAWTLDSFGDADFPSDILGIYVDTNSPYVKIEKYAGAAWSLMYTAQLFTPVYWTRVGECAELSYSTTEAIIEEDELVGCTFSFGTGSGVDTRVINRNTSGVLYSSGTYKKPRIYLDGIDDGEGAGGASTAGLIYHRRALMLISLAGAGAERIRVSFDATPGGAETDHAAPADGYYESGVCLIGPVVPFGWDPSATRSVAYEANTAITRGPDGRKRSRVRGPVLRTVEVAHVEGVDTSEMYSFDADHILASDVGSAETVAMRGDSPWAIRGMQRYLDGPGTTCILIPRMPHLTTANNALVRGRAGGAVYGRISSLDPQNSLLARSTEEENEVIRWGFRFDEEG